MTIMRSVHGTLGVAFAVLGAGACSSTGHEAAGAGGATSGSASTATGSAPTGSASTGSAATGGGATTATSGSTGSGMGGSTTTTGGGGASSASNWVMGYYTSWEDPANGGPYGVPAIDWDGLTHVAAAFYLPDGNGGWMAGGFDDATAKLLIAAAHAHGKKAIASIGGSDSAPKFEMSTQTSMTKFVASLEALLAMGYDGIDIDWEGGKPATDQPLMTSLIGALRTASPKAILTLTAGYENENLLDDLSWYGTIAAQLDQINLMTYGMSGAWEGWQSWHSSPLHWNNVSSTPTGIDSSVAHYLAANVPAGKLGVGIGFYGECYTAPVTAPVQALGNSMVAASDGTISYANVMSSFYSASAYHYDAAAQAPFLTLNGNNSQKCTYVTYEDATSIAAKGAWAKSKGLGGMIIWELREGYVPAGATVQEQNPLLETLKTSFLQ